MENVSKVELCPITDGTCPRNCGFPAHITIKRANKEAIPTMSNQEIDKKFEGEEYE